jgi:hypothetical protein
MNDQLNESAGAGKEPLSIWFFVGIILLGYGLIVMIAGLVGDDRPTVLAELRPALWWGAIMLVAGVIFTAIGLRRPAAAAPPPPADHP